MGLCGESGEVIDIVKKHLAQGHELNKDKIIEELGDVLWYVAEVAYVLNVKLEDVFTLNIEKLSKRYKNGFSVSDSINRKN
jgi:NTP pyrophosphatase (non-canonical NTP hydrolase)